MNQIKSFFKNFSNIYTFIPVIVSLFSVPSFLFYSYINPKAHIFHFFMAGMVPGILSLIVFFALHTFFTSRKIESKSIVLQQHAIVRQNNVIPFKKRDMK